jgi:hypothetical protein
MVRSTSGSGHKDQVNGSPFSADIVAKVPDGPALIFLL